MHTPSGQCCVHLFSRILSTSFTSVSIFSAWCYSSVSISMGLSLVQIEPANPAEQAYPSYFTIPNTISCELSGLCPQRRMDRIPVRTGILPSLAWADVGRMLDLYLYCDGKVYSALIPPDFVWIAQLRVSGNSSYWVNTLADSYSFSVSNIVY